MLWIEIDAGSHFSDGKSPSGRRLQNLSTSGLLLEAEVYHVAGSLASRQKAVIYVCVFETASHCTALPDLEHSM